MRSNNITGWHIQKGVRRRTYLKNCARCGIEFSTPWPSKVTNCSRLCAAKSRAEKRGLTLRQCPSSAPLAIMNRLKTLARISSRRASQCLRITKGDLKPTVQVGSEIHRTVCRAVMKKAWTSGAHDHQKTGRLVWHKRTCPQCGVEFQADQPKRKFCRFECSAIFKQSGTKRPLSSNRSDREKLRYRNDPAYRMKKIIKQGLRRMLKGLPRHRKAEEYIGCSRAELVRHIEAQFEKWMTWENWGIGPGTWQIDHIVPCDKFDGTSDIQLRQCWHWSNLRPLRAKLNNRKGAKHEGPIQQPLLLCPS